MRSFFDNLSLEMSLGRGAEITIVAQKTITNAEIITLDHLCSGKVPTVTSLVMKLDPAENESDPRLLTKALHYLLRDITAKVKIGIEEFIEDIISTCHRPPFSRRIPRLKWCGHRFWKRSNVCLLRTRLIIVPGQFGTCTFTGRYLSSQCIGGCRFELWGPFPRWVNPIYFTCLNVYCEG